MNDEFINKWVDLEKNYVKRLIKKIVRKMMAPIIREMVAIINTLEKSKEEIKTIAQSTKENARKLDGVIETAERNKQEIETLVQNVIMITQGIEDSARKLDRVVETAERNKQDIEENKMSIKNKKIWQEQQWKKIEERNSRYENDQRDKLGAIARELTEVYWSSIDFRNACQENKQKTIICPICGCEAQEDTLEKKETDCIFGGGHLIRHVCPQCGGIFGPAKFSDRPKKAMDDDYVINYIGYNEADSTAGEIETFMMLHPNKDGIYLNYGCGVWADTITRLNEDGYHVYGYEPYASDIDNPYLISDIKQLSKMRFDGIFSHDLLEHLMNPVDELRFMKSILRSPTAKMAHSTACYEYKFEYTRFHTCFYTGKAVQYLCEKTGLKVVDYKDDGAAKDFICYVFGVRDEMISIRNYMHSKQGNEMEFVADGEDGVIFGPYLNLLAGSYRIFLAVDYCETEKAAEMMVTANLGQTILSSFSVPDGKSEIRLNLMADEENVEFVFRTKNSQKVILKDIGFL